MSEHTDTAAPGAHRDAGDDLFGEDDVTLDETQSAPRSRPSRLTLVLAALLLAVTGFVGGVATTQRSDDAAASGLPEGLELPEGVELPAGIELPEGLPEAMAGGGTSLPGLLGNTSGEDTSTVSLVDGNVLYVRDAEGTTVKVVLDERTRVSTVGPGELADLEEGDTVVLRGTEETPGRFRARSITQTGG